MADQLQLRGGTTNEHSTFTGALREVTVDTDKDTLIVHDAATAGGHPLLREDGSNSALSLGTAGTPSIKFTGDTNTGLYSPGADQVAISTGGSARLYVAADGDVGLNTISPESKLHIDSGSGSQPLVIQASGNTAAYVRFKNSANSNGYMAYNNSDFTFWPGGTERLRIDSSGRLLVGTSTAPTGTQVGTAHLVVNGRTSGNTGGFIGLLRGATPTAANQTLGAVFFGGDGDEEYAAVRAYSDGTPSATSAPGNLSFQTTATDATTPTERMRIDSSGRVGVGTTSPSDKLHVSGVIRAARSTNASQYGTISIENGNVVINAEGSINTTFENGGSEKVRIDTSGRVGIGTSSPQALLECNDSANDLQARFGTLSAARNPIIRLQGRNTANNQNCFADIQLDAENQVLLLRDPGTSGAGIGTNPVAIDNGGNVGIGTTSPSTLLHLSSASPAIRFTDSDTSEYAEITQGGAITYISADRGNAGGGALVLRNGGTNERARIDSSGRLLVGTSSAIASGTEKIQALGSLSLYDSTASAAGAGSVINFRTDGGATGAIKASISGQNDSTYSYAGRLVFSTTADGASSPTERMRIDRNGSVYIQTTTLSSTSDGCYFNAASVTGFHQVLVHSTTNSTHSVLYINRQGSDGQLVQFRQADAIEGNISVSGSTVSYNGAHLSRWSQPASGADFTGILRGSVLSNTDEMCIWDHEAQQEVLYTDEDEALLEGASVGDVKTPAKAAFTEENEQLNRMKISDVEGDKNVAGIFDCFDGDEEFPEDFYCAMTGDFIIRIAQGVTVERGDLLMSAGDGTAKPQDDDIIRSKTIAKVTSTNVSCTYDDGSYCVPCVLMAC